MLQRLLEIWFSFRALPLWVQAWVALILAPVNFASLWFMDGPGGGWVALLAIIAILLNIPILFYSHGYSKLMAFPHLIPWTILVAWLVFERPETSGGYDLYLTILLVVNSISLVFDYVDALAWIGGDRKVTRRE